MGERMVKIPMNLPAGPGQEAFLQHFDAQVGNRMASSRGQAGRRSDGVFESATIGPVSFDEGTVELSLRYEKSFDGELLYIEADRIGTESTTLDWELLVRHLIHESSTAALAAKTQTFFRRTYCYYIGSQLDGEYWFGKLRFAPAWPEDDQPTLMNAERVVVFDQMIDAMDGTQASLIANEATARWSARFSLLLDAGLHPAHHEMRWVYPNAQAGLNKSVRSHLGFAGYGVVPDSLPDKGELCRLGKWNRDLLSPYQEVGLLSFPPQSRSILRNIDQTSPKIGNAFDSCARLYQVGLDVGRKYPSAGLAYRVASIEALSKTESPDGFSNFMRKYCCLPGVEIDPFLEFLYGSARSSHFHAGAFPLGECDRQDFPKAFMSSEYIDKSQRLQTSMLLMHRAIATWLLTQNSSIHI
jgi:hypothetical protein